MIFKVGPKFSIYISNQDIRWEEEFPYNFSFIFQQFFKIFFCFFPLSPKPQNLIFPPNLHHHLPRTIALFF